MFHISDVSVRFGNLTILDQVSFQLEESQWLMVVGPNGAGKSTLVSAIAQGVPYTGQICFEGKDISLEKPRLLAQKIAILSQKIYINYGFRVEEIVRLGRYAWSKGFLSGPSSEDDEQVEYALQITGMQSLRDHSVLTLSGGELQRTFLAQVLAQDPRLLILDEPANHLDLSYQKQIFDILQNWLRRPGHAIISVVHDLSLARVYGTHALLLHKGLAVANSDIHTALANHNLSKSYSMDVFAWMQQMLSQWVGG